MATGNFDKARNVAFLCYLDDWGKSYGELLEFLDDLHMPCACSPVHNADKFTAGDVNKWIRKHTDSEGRLDRAAIESGMPEVGQAKKKHVHVMLCAPGPWTPDKFLDTVKDFYPINYFEKVNSVPSMLRYFAHMDSPEKTPYSCLEIHGFGGLDMTPLLKTDKLSGLEILLDVMDYILKKDVRHYNRLVRWAISTGDIDTIACVTGRASFFANYFKSASDERRDKKEREKKLKEMAKDSTYVADETTYVADE